MRMNNVETIGNRSVAFTTRDTTTVNAAKLMRQGHVGSLVVVEMDGRGRRMPVGMVTDRDIVLEVVATGLDPAAITVDDIMERDLVVCGEKQSALEALEIMRFKGVRRLPVVDAEGGLVSIVTVDDVLEKLSEELGEIARIVAREQAREAGNRRST